MTPTLGMAVMREAAISAFKSEPFYTVQLGLPEFTATCERLKKKKIAEELVENGHLRKSPIQCTLSGHQCMMLIQV